MVRRGRSGGGRGGRGAGKGRGGLVGVKDEGERGLVAGGGQSEVVG
jgi:hypothetical protein